MAKIRICIVTDAWHPQINGVVTTLSRTAATLEAWGHGVKLITPAQFRTVACPTYPDIKLSLLLPGTIRKILADFAPNAVHIATEGPLGWAARSACGKLGLRFTTSYHTRFPEYVRLRWPVPLSVSYLVVKCFHGRATRTMVAPTLIDELRRRGFNNLAPWSRGVDTELFKPRDKDYLHLAHPIFLYAGRVAVEKNLPAFLNLTLPGSKVVVGDGPALAHLKRRYPEVLFTGAKRGVELARHMASADVFVFPSLTDTFGVVLLEAMACGVPVAAYPVTGPRYIVKNGINGYLDTDLGRAAIQALELTGLQSRLFARDFTWESCSKQFFGNLVLQAVVDPVSHGDQQQEVERGNTTV
ncbi:glycosyltransferase family 4 protein [Thermodesulfobacteriota bacterium B35]